MEERVPPPPGKPPPESEPGPTLLSGTYLVQVPKDKIYRIPPPENALIVERHLNSSNQKTSSSSSSFFSGFLIFIIILIFFLAIVGVVTFFFVLKPNSPNFSIKHLIVKNMNDHPNHKSFVGYDLILKSENPNRMISFSYHRGGNISLSFNKLTMATGDSTALEQGTMETKDFHVILAGADEVLSRNVEKRFKDRKSGKSLVLSMNVPVEMKMGGIRAWDTNMDILCNLKVNTLGKDIQILSQECLVKT